jgi:hypothetical protein
LSKSSDIKEDDMTFKKVCVYFFLLVTGIAITDCAKLRIPGLTASFIRTVKSAILKHPLSFTAGYVFGYLHLRRFIHSLVMRNTPLNISENVLKNIDITEF